VFLTHYYHQNDRPFQSLSALTDRSALAIITNLQHRQGLVYRRFKDPENYLKLRCETEHWLRTEFIKKGGKPVTNYPQYFVVDRSVWIEAGYQGNFNLVQIPLTAFNSEQISFTYPDSMVSYWLQSHSDKDYYQHEYHGRVFSIDEITEIIDRFGIPDREWQNRSERKYDLFIEAQVWSDDLHQLIIEPSTDLQLAL
jgi:hypothetical protein